MITVLLTACNGTDIDGLWVESVPGMDNLIQGFNLEAGGKASSVNMVTLQYETWEKKGDKLILTGKSIGNHQTLSFADTLVIEKVTRDSLILCRGDLVLKYSKMNKENVGDTIPALLVNLSEHSVSVQGKLVIGHEVRSFVQEGDTVDY